ncbi:erythromycin esterase family protein [Hymenobacter caeli]|uniref:Erythromycin esterase-like protein n=1 Tax=Hymenobacter caeli TaxID=2735894 RepID=A0ABX2FLJ4_9BACT|nr:erythromycin esterase family protein [Hymenobacter caeli]NRT18013.1 erythromycin esterase-like protein [Hymenobacter caeli]
MTLIRLLLWALCAGAVMPARAQPAAPGPAPVPARPLRSLSPSDTTFAELEFLRAEIGGARVVFLGEPTHGEGNVLAAKARLVAFLQQRMGFTTLAMESGFFELHKAQQGIAAGKSVAKNLASSVFPVWMGTQEFRAVVPLVGPDGLRVMGFDPQLSGDYSDDLADDLEDFLEPEKGADAVNYELVGDVVDSLAGHYAFPAGHPLAEFEAQLAAADRLLRRAAGAPAAARRAEAAFWQQCLRSLGALARDYAAHHPNAKSGAVDSNPRDAQMADNLLWYLRQHPAEKVICWGALPHFANHVEVLGSEELRNFQPMGRAVKAALGPNQVYILGTLAGGGTHGPAGSGGVPVPPPAPGTLEADLLARSPGPLAFVSLKHDAPGLQLTTYAFDYQPLAGPWSEVVDGFLFFRNVAPPHVAPPDSAAGAPDTTAAAAVAADTAAAAVAARAAPLGSRNPAAGRGGALVHAAAAAPDVSGVRLVRGQVLDQRSRAGVPYASVVVPGQGKGTTANAQGRFALELPGPTALQISSLGYATAVVKSPRGNEELTVPLAPAAYALDEARVVSAPPSPLEIMKRVIKAAPTNYEQQDYATEVYAHRRVSNFDTLRYEAETVGRLRVPAGYRHFVPGPPGAGKDQPTLEVQQQHVLAQRGAPDPDPYAAGPGLTAASADPLRISPLFVGRNLRRFTLRLDSVRGQGPDAVYVLSFSAKQADRRSTGTSLLSGYQGQLLVRARDYAVLRYEALWQADTAAANAAARKRSGKAGAAAGPLAPVLTAGRTTHVVDYVSAGDGRYYARRSAGQGLSAGRGPGRHPFYYQVAVEQFFKPLPTAGPPPALPKAGGTPGAPGAPAQPYRPEFWSSYPRPGGALAAPATKR